MTINELLAALVLQYKQEGLILHPPATDAAIIQFEEKTGFILPDDFKTLYRVCNGFDSDLQMFRLLPLEKATIHELDYSDTWFYFADYMIHSDVWGVRRTTDGGYEIFNGSAGAPVVLTTSLSTFLERYLKGGIFDKGGLYDWEDELNAG